MDGKLWIRISTLKKKLIILSLSLLLFSTNVYATCESVTPSYQYLNNGTYSAYSGGSVQTTSFRIRSLKSGGMGTEQAWWNGKAYIYAYGKQLEEPTIYFQYRTTSNTWINITNSTMCTKRISTEYFGNDQIINQTRWYVQWNCNLPLNTNPNIIYIQIDHEELFKLENASQCYEKNTTPNEDYSQLEENMYNYYSSLWDKSNIQEQNIMERIDEAASEVTSNFETTQEPGEIDIDAGVIGDNEDLENGLTSESDRKGLKQAMNINNYPHNATKYLWWMVSKIRGITLVGQDPTIQDIIPWMFSICLTIGVIKLILRR